MPDGALLRAAVNLYHNGGDCSEWSEFTVGLHVTSAELHESPLADANLAQINLNVDEVDRTHGVRR